MKMLRHAVALVTALALGVGLSVALVATGGSASAASDPQARCAAANQSLGSAQGKYTIKVKKAKKAKKKVVKVKKKNKKALKKAKKAHASKAKIAKVKKKNKKALKKAKKVRKNRVAAVKRAQQRVNSAKTIQAYACARQTGDPLTPNQLTQLLQIFQNSGGGLTLDSLNDLLSIVFPSELPGLDALDLNQILNALNSALDPDQLEALAALLDGFGGILSPDQVQSLIGQIVAQLSGLPEGGASPEQIVSVLTSLIGTLSTALDDVGLHAVGDLLNLLLTGMSDGDLSSLDLAGLTDVLDEILPGVADALSPDQLTDLLALVQNGTQDPQALAGLLSGLLDPGQITGILDGLGSQADLTTVLGQLLPQLGAIGGGDFELPDPAALTGILTGLGGVVGGLLGGILCGPLPILCP